MYFAKFKLKVPSLSTWHTFIKWKMPATFWTINLRNHWISHSLPMLLSLKILTLIFLHFIGNGEKAKVLKYVLRFTLEYVIYSFDQSIGLATFPDVLAQILLRYNAWYQSRHFFFFFETSWNVQFHGLNGTSFEDYLSFWKERKLVLAYFMTVLFKLWSRYLDLFKNKLEYFYTH